MWQVFLVPLNLLRVLSTPCPLICEPSGSSESTFPYQAEYLISEWNVPIFSSILYPKPYLLP